MIGLLCFVVAVLASPFKSKIRLEAENAALRHQLVVLRRKLKGRARITSNDRWFFVQLYCWFPSILPALMIIRPETLVRWHRAGFRRYWRWRSRSPGGRPPIEAELRALIRQMSRENLLWGAPRIHGELLKLGFELAQSSVAKYMVKHRGPPSQGWRTFLRNHEPDIAAMDLFVVPTIGFRMLYGFVIVRLDRRDLVWINSQPTRGGVGCTSETSGSMRDLSATEHTYPACIPRLDFSPGNFRHSSSAAFCRRLCARSCDTRAGTKASQRGFIHRGSSEQQGLQAIASSQRCERMSKESENQA
jgi:hypothetical protein